MSAYVAQKPAGLCGPQRNSLGLSCPDRRSTADSSDHRGLPDGGRFLELLHGVGEKLKEEMSGPSPYPSPSQSAATLETLKLLERTAQYLARLPPVPTTTQLIREIAAHLQDPSIKAAQREAEQVTLLQATFVGGTFSVVGAPVFLAAAQADRLTFQIHEHPNIEGMSEEVRALEREARMKQLIRGVRMDLRPADTKHLGIFDPVLSLLREID